MKQYLVHTSGEVLDRQSKAYVVNATSVEEAQEIAKSNFAEEFYVVDNSIYAKPYKRGWKAIFAIIFMIIPIALSFIGWRIGHDTIYIRPDYISSLCALVFYMAFIVRFKGIHRVFETKLDIGLCASVILLLASFIQTLFVTKNISIFGLTEIPVDTKIIVFVAIILSWFGLKLVSAICMLSVGVFAIFNITILNNAMGSFFGSMYIICAFIGLLLYISIEPAVIEALPYLNYSVNRGLDYVKRDFVEAGNSAKGIHQNIKNRKSNMLNKEE